MSSRVQWPYILAGTLGFHLALATIADAYRLFHPYVPAEPAPHLEMVEIVPEPEPVLQPPPPPLPAPAPEPTPAPIDPTPPPETHVPSHAPPAVPTPPDPTPPPVVPDPTPPDPDDHNSGGEQVVHMDDIAPTDHGVAVRQGKSTGGRVGRGGAGGGTGTGTGSGSGGDAPPDPPPPVSIAKLKTPAKPRGDFSYFDAGKDYPAEARRQGIEGPIKVKLVVDATGKVASTALVTHLGYGLDELALERAKSLTFTPAVDTDDHPTQSLVIWTFNMTLPK